MQGHYFVSHATQDKAVADRLVAELEARGLRCWIAPRDIAPGVVWATAIEEAIRMSVGLVLLLSRASNDSGFIHGEVTLAANNRKSIYPIKLDDVPPAKELQLFIAHRQIVPLGLAAERIAGSGATSDGMAAQQSRPAALPIAPLTLSKRNLAYLATGATLLCAVWLLWPAPPAFVTVPSVNAPTAAVAVPSLPAPMPAPVVEHQQPVVTPPPVEQRIVLPPVIAAPPPPSHATIRSESNGTLRPRTSLDAYTPPPEAVDSHGIIQNDQSGPLRPRINLGQ